jgi:hypothetical protein
MRSNHTPYFCLQDLSRFLSSVFLSLLAPRLQETLGVISTFRQTFRTITDSGDDASLLHRRPDRYVVFFCNAGPILRLNCNRFHGTLALRSSLSYCSLSSRPATPSLHLFTLHFFLRQDLAVQLNASSFPFLSSPAVPESLQLLFCCSLFYVFRLGSLSAI